MPGVIAVEHGYGHREMGASQHYLDGEPLAMDKRIAAGINLNDLGFADPTREVPNTWLDWVTGAAVRQGFQRRSSNFPRKRQTKKPAVTAGFLKFGRHERIMRIFDACPAGRC